MLHPVGNTDGERGGGRGLEDRSPHYLELLEKQPDDAQCHSSLGGGVEQPVWGHYRQRDYEQAVSLAREAVYHEEQAQKERRDQYRLLRSIGDSLRGFGHGS